MSGIDENKLPVLLSIRGEQYFDDIDPDATELMTEGTMALTEDGIVLSYEESELTGMEGTTTTFEVKGPRVTLTRSGAVNSQMVFEEGRQHTSLRNALRRAVGGYPDQRTEAQPVRAGRPDGN